jgi:AI-2 transport protein TqsA
MSDAQTVRNRLLAVLAIVAAVAALRWSYPVTMPLVVAVFVIAAAWPIKPWLERRLPTGLSYAGTVLALLLVLLCFVGAIYLATAQLAQILGQNQDRLRDLYSGYVAWAEQRGLPTPGGEGGYDRLAAIVRVVFGQLYAFLGYLVVIVVLVAMGLPEVPALAARLRAELDAGDSRALVDTIGRIADKCRRYIGVTVLTSLITGAASAGWSLAVGLELALTWGVLNFLLNFVPLIGNAIGVLPPTLYAIVQFEGWTMPIVTCAGFVVLQVTISNVIYPMLQGRGMALPPVVIVLALLFWTWVWGIVGALLAVPLTAALVIVCQHFESTEKLARLVARGE